MSPTQPVRVGGVLVLTAISTVAWAGSRPAQTDRQRTVARHQKYFNAYRGALRRGVLGPVVRGGSLGANAVPGLGLGADVGGYRVTDAHGKNHWRLGARVGVETGGSIGVRAMVTHDRARPGVSRRKLAPKAGVKGSDMTSVAVGVGLGGFEDRWGDRRYDTGGVKVGLSFCPGTPAWHAHGQLPVFPATDSRLLRTVKKGQRMVTKAQRALRANDTAGFDRAVHQLKQLRQQTRRLYKEHRARF